MLKQYADKSMHKRSYFNMHRRNAPCNNPILHSGPASMHMDNRLLVYLFQQPAVQKCDKVSRLSKPMR